MATSGTYVFNATAGDIIKEALGIIGEYDPTESIPDSESNDALRTLNMMLKLWEHKVGLWTVRELYLFFQADTIRYNLGITGDHFTETAVKTEVATAASSGASSVVIDATTDFNDTFDRDGLVTSTTPSGAGTVTLDGDLVTNAIATLSGQRKVLIFSDGDESGVVFSLVGQNTAGVAVTENITGPNTTTVYSANEYKTVTSVTINGAGTGNIEVGQVGDHVGIELDDDSLHWTFIAGALSTTLPLVTALTDTAALDNHVYSYKIKAPRPIELIETRLHKSDAQDVPLITAGRLDYELLSNKRISGTVNQVFYDKQLGNGVMEVWPMPSDMKDYLKFTAKIPIQDMVNLTDDFEVAKEWFLPIAWALAPLLAPKYEKPIDPAMLLMAETLYDEAMDADTENTSSYLQIGQGWHGRGSSFGGARG